MHAMVIVAAILAIPVSIFVWQVIMYLVSFLMILMSLVGLSTYFKNRKHK